jgi:hypothetical protein
LAHPSIDALAQQVGVSAVSGILLDPVHHQLPNCDPVPSQTLAQIRVLGQRSIGRGLLARQNRVRSVDLGLFGDGSVEVVVTLAVQLRQRITLTDSVAPIQFRFGEMPK